MSADFSSIPYGPAHFDKFKVVIKHHVLQNIMGGRVKMSQFPLNLAGFTQRSCHALSLDPLSVVLPVLSAFSCFMGPDVRLHETPHESTRPVRR